jgi:hypothetical protein
VVMAFVGGSGGDRGEQSRGHRVSTQGTPEMGKHKVVLQSELPPVAGSTGHASQTHYSVGFR